MPVANNINVYVGMSGGVDSSLAAALLLEQGYNVTGVYMKNWTLDLPGMVCPWADDVADAKRVAVQLNIPFKIYDFQKEYKRHVVDYMVEEYSAGRTPNPDIMCNQDIKFKLFLKTALSEGADMIATGHYADVKEGCLLKAKDASKDQTYFLYRVTQAALAKTVFPLGGYLKTEVRTMAMKRALFTAAKKESMGICFVGKVGIKDFLSQYVTPNPGPIISQDGKHIGEHEGAIFYTIGQRHGLDVGGGLPYYVSGKNMAKNEVYVTTDLNSENMWKKSIIIRDSHWIGAPPEPGITYQFRLRHRAPLVNGYFENKALTKIILENEVRAVTSGQSIVTYDQEMCLGGGIMKG